MRNNRYTNKRLRAIGVKTLTWDGKFDCDFCGENFGNDPIKLVLHMVKKHNHSGR